MPKPATIELVIFDCDGVLIDSEGHSGQVLIGMLAELGIDVDFDYFCVNYVGRSFPTVAKDIRKTFDLPLPAGFEAQYRASLLRAFERHLQPTPGVALVLEQLGVPRCVATSSSPERVSRSLRIAGLASYFTDTVFTASEVRHGKPAPDLFLHVANRMRVDPAACLVIEDSLPGVQAALAADMDVLRYTGGAHLKGRVLKHDAHVQTFDKWPDIFHMRAELHKVKDAGNGQ